jgi:hypothetical protein
MKLTLASNEEINLLHSKFKKFNVHLVEEPKKIFNFIGIMDVFNRTLTLQEADELLHFPEHNLKYGKRFYNVFTELYRIESGNVYVIINKKWISKNVFKFILNTLSKTERNVFRKLFATKKGIYKIGDLESLMFLAKLSVNESFFVNYFFPTLETVIIGNYELSFPIYSKSEIGYTKCKDIIEQNDLFIR